jgi:transcriptional regulator with XRE-family HTH domain
VVYLKFLRLERRLSQRQLAVLAKIPQPDLSRIENGRSNPTRRELDALASVLGCPADRLMKPVVSR